MKPAIASFGDTVHYVNPPKIFTGCEGSYMYDDAGTAYLDLQMWYSAVNFGYKNKRLEQKMIEQLQSLPQVASQYLHPTKIELAKFIAQDAEKKWGHTGRVHFNVGGAQAIEDSLKVVRNASGGKSLMFAFEGGTTAARWAPPASPPATAIAAATATSATARSSSPFPTRSAAPRA